MATVYNFDGLKCPRCYRESALSRPADSGGRYECRNGCGARFKFVPATGDAIASLIHVIDDTPYNAGARMADDWVCQCCGQRGHLEAVCAERYERARR